MDKGKFMDKGTNTRFFIGEISFNKHFEIYEASFGTVKWSSMAKFDTKQQCIEWFLKKFKERGYGILMLFDFSDEKGVQFKELIPERED